MTKIRIFIVVIFFIFLLSLTTYAHGGKTDSAGGHYNRSTGEYHYHHGYPAHDHYDMDGDGDNDCPYNFKETTNTTSSSTNDALSIYSEDSTDDAKSHWSWLFPIANLIFILLIDVVIVKKNFFNIKCNADYIYRQAITKDDHVYHCFSETELKNAENQRNAKKFCLLEQLESHNIMGIKPPNYIMDKVYDQITHKYNMFKDHRLLLVHERNEKNEFWYPVFKNGLRKLLIINGIIFCLISAFPIAILISNNSSQFKYWDSFLYCAVIVSIFKYCLYCFLVWREKENDDKTMQQDLELFRNICWEDISGYFKLCSLERLSNTPDNVYYKDGLPQDSKNSFYKYVSSTGKVYHSKEVCHGHKLTPIHEYYCKSLSPCMHCYPKLNLEGQEWFDRYLFLQEVKQTLEHKKE